MVNLTSDTASTSAAPTKPAVTAIAHLLRFLGKRLREASTIRGALLIATAAGVYIEPEKQEAIVAFGLGLAGIIGVFFPDQPGE